MWNWLVGPIGMNQHIGARSCSLFLLSVIREEESVSKKAVVPKYLGEMLACYAWITPPSHFGSQLVGSTWM